MRVKAKVEVNIYNPRKPKDRQQSTRSKGRGMEQHLLDGLRGNQPTLTSDFRPPRLRDNALLLFKQQQSREGRLKDGESFF